MENSTLYETDFERITRERNEKICSEYVDHKEKILSKEIAPNRVIMYLSRKFYTSHETVKNVLNAEAYMSMRRSL